MKVLVGFPAKWLKALMLLGFGFGAMNVSGQEMRKAILQPAPVYPEIARQFRLSGTVKVQVVVGSDGQIKETKVVGGHPLLAEAALTALKKWKFAPSNAETTQVLEFAFKL
jgi:TonB family protein